MSSMGSRGPQGFGTTRRYLWGYVVCITCPLLVLSNKQIFFYFEIKYLQLVNMCVLLLKWLFSTLVAMLFGWNKDNSENGFCIKFTPAHVCVHRYLA